MLFIILLILLAGIGYLVLTYFRLLTQVETIHHHQQQIDYLLNRRFKLLESLLNTKKYSDSEKLILSEAITLHQQADHRLLHESQISELLLKISEEEISNIEKNLLYAKQAYHDSIELYDMNTNTFPANFLVPYIPRLDIAHRNNKQ